MRWFQNTIIQSLLVWLILISILGSIPISQAHEIIPRALQEYVVSNPNATPEEIQKFAEVQSPEFAGKYTNGTKILAIVRNNKTSLIDNMYDFFKLWIWHILSWLDHILFVLSLLLIFISWKEVLKLTWVFTIAHSITLILAWTGILVLSSRIVEPIIALSIAYVAFTSVFLRSWWFFWNNKSKMFAIFFFGLFHGLWFAWLLQEINIPQDKFISSLLAFNLGIEGGQLIIVGIAFPFIYFLKDLKIYGILIKIFSAIIISIALFWFFERIMGV